MADIDEQDLGTRLAAAVRGFREHLINNPQLLAQLAAEEARRKARDRYIDERLARQAATPDGPRRWALPDDAEATARIVAVVNWRRGSVHGMTADNAEAQRWCREIIDRYGDNLAASQVVGLVKVGPGSLFVDALTDATPAADGQDGAAAEALGRIGRLKEASSDDR